MTKIDTLTPVTNLSTGSAVAAINENYDKIVEAFNNTVSRDGSSPNHMDADIDMNGNDILNANIIEWVSQSLDVAELTVGGQNINDLVDIAVDASASAAANASTASAAASSASASAASAAAVAASLPAITANTMLVDNSAGTLRQTKTFPQVNDLLEKSTWAFDNNTLYKSRSNKDRWQDSYRLNEELNFTGGSVATDSAVLTALFNRAKAAGRREIILPAGDIYLETACALVNASATNSIRLVGQGPDVTRFRNNSAAQQWFTIGTGSGGRTSGIRLEGFSAEPAVAMNDSGSVFYLRNTSDITFKDVIARSVRNGWALGLGASATNDVVYTGLQDCGGTSSGTSGAAMIRLGSGGILQIGGNATRWNANGGHIFMEHADATYNWDGLYVYGQFFEFFSKYMLSTGKGVVNFEWTGGQVDRATIFFHAEPSIVSGSNRNWNIHHTQILGFAAGGGIGCLLGKGSSTDTQAIEDMKVNNNVFNGLTDAAIYAPNGELFAYGNNIVSCAQLGGAAPLGGSLIRVGQGMCYVHGTHGRRNLATPGVAYVTGIQWDGAALATRKEADNQFFSFSGAAQTGTI